MRAPRFLVVLVLVGCSAASIQIEPPAEDVDVTIEPSPLPREFMGIPFGASLEDVLVATQELTCRPLEPDEFAAGHEQLVCQALDESTAIVFFFHRDGESLRFVGGLHSAAFSVPVRAEARYLGMLEGQLRAFGKPAKVIDSPGKKTVLWKGSLVLASLAVDLEEDVQYVTYATTTREFWELRFAQ